jgi:HEAT repeat protein
MLTPDQFADASAYDLLMEAAKGRIGIDQRWAHAILDKGESAVADIIRYGESYDDPDIQIEIDEDIFLILRQLRSPASVPFFIEYLRTSTEGIPDVLVDAIYPVREAAFEPLIHLYGELEEDEGAEVAFLLASFRMHDPRVLQILLDRLEYDVAEGAICLGLHGDQSARPALEKMMSEVGEDEHLRRQLEEAIDDLATERTDEEPEFHIDEFFPEKAGPDPTVLEEDDLVPMLEASDAEYRFAGVAGFIGQDYGKDIRDRLLKVAQTDPAEEVRAKAWEALGSETADDEEVYLASLAKLRDENAPKLERAGALVGLGQRADEAEIRPFAEEFYKDPATRAAALSAMWNSLDKTYAKYFLPHLQDEDHDVRKQAISGVGYLGITEAAERLRDMFGDAEFRSNALFAYALSARTEVSPGRMRGFLRRVDELAGGLSEDENELVEIALDERLLLHGHKPLFRPHNDHGQHHDHANVHAPAAPEKKPGKTGRNDPCPCGSGKKYKKCCGA